MDNLAPKKTPDPVRLAPPMGRLFPAILFAAALGGFSCSPKPKTTTKPVAGSLNVLVRPPDRMIEPIPVSDPGALPVQSGGAMTIDVELDEPAFIYLVWANSAGEILPLYPWNNETLDVKDISQPPPVRRGTKRIFSPLLGRSWAFGNRSGIETIILLVRHTALPENLQLATLLNSPPTSKLDNPTDLIKLRIQNPDGTKDNSALAAFLEPLSKHFDLIEAVQFTHADKKSD
jgi:hypothetical protein